MLYFLQRGLVGFGFTSGPVTQELHTIVHTALLGLLHNGWDGPDLGTDEILQSAFFFFKVLLRSSVKGYCKSYQWTGRLSVFMAHQQKI